MVRQTRTIKETVKEAQPILSQKGPRKTSKTIEETLKEAEQYLNKGLQAEGMKTRSSRHQIQPLQKRISKKTLPSPTKSSVSVAAKEDKPVDKREKNLKQSHQNSAQKQNGIIDKIVVESKPSQVIPNLEDELKDLSLSLSPRRPARDRSNKPTVKKSPKPEPTQMTQSKAQEDNKDKIKVSSQRQSQGKEAKEPEVKQPSEKKVSQERVTRNSVRREIQIQPQEAPQQPKVNKEQLLAPSSQNVQPSVVEDQLNQEKRQPAQITLPPKEPQTRITTLIEPKDNVPPQTQNQINQRRSTRLAKKSDTQEVNQSTAKKEQNLTQTQESNQNGTTQNLTTIKKDSLHQNVEADQVPAISKNPIVEFPKQKSRGDKKKQPEPKGEQGQSIVQQQVPEIEIAQNHNDIEPTLDQKTNIDEFFNQIRMGRLKSNTNKQGNEKNQSTVEKIASTLNSAQDIKQNLEDIQNLPHEGKNQKETEINIQTELQVRDSDQKASHPKEKSGSPSKNNQTQIDQEQCYKVEPEQVIEKEIVDKQVEKKSIEKRKVASDEEIPEEPEPVKKLKRAKVKDLSKTKKNNDKESIKETQQQPIASDVAQRDVITKVEVERNVNFNDAKQEVVSKQKTKSDKVFSQIENRGMTPIQEIEFLQKKELSSNQKKKRKQLLKQRVLQQRIKSEFQTNPQSVMTAQRVYSIPKVAMLDVVFLVSTYEDNREFIAEIANSISKLDSEIFSKCRRDDLNVKYGVVAYQDHNQEDYYLTYVIDLEPFDEILNKLKSLRYGNESDGAQAVFDGMHDAAIKIGWRQERSTTYGRYLFHIGDKPPHGTSFTKGIDKYPNGCPCRLTLDQIVHRINIRDIKYVMVKSVNSDIESLCKLLKKLLLTFKEVQIAPEQLPTLVTKDIINDIFPIEYY